MGVSRDFGTAGRHWHLGLGEGLWLAAGVAAAAAAAFGAWSARSGLTDLETRSLAVETATRALEQHEADVLRARFYLRAVKAGYDIATLELARLDRGGGG